MDQLLIECSGRFPHATTQAGAEGRIPINAKRLLHISRFTSSGCRIHQMNTAQGIRTEEAMATSTITETAFSPPPQEPSAHSRGSEEQGPLAEAAGQMSGVQQHACVDWHCASSFTQNEPLSNSELHHAWQLS